MFNTFFYIVGVALSRDWKNVRLGLRHDHEQLDPALHGCNEDPTPQIRSEIIKAFDERLSALVPPDATSHTENAEESLGFSDDEDERESIKDGQLIETLRTSHISTADEWSAIDV